MDPGEDFNRAPGSMKNQFPSCVPPGMKPLDANVDYPMLLVPSMIPQTVLFPNLQPVYLPTPNPEFLRMMQLYAAGQQYERQMNKLATDKVPIEGEYDSGNIPLAPGRNVQQEHLIELTKIALRGCDLGERVAVSHQKRPCFKKIDSLCARMKQDLMRADGVLANINSQGTAWAVKDFIFAFTRIINAWIIIKGYATCPSQAESLNKVRAALSPNFVDAFAKWQEGTMEFVDEIIKSFVSLDNLVQTQRVPSKKWSPARSNSNSTDDLSDNVEDSSSFHTTASDEDKLGEVVADEIPEHTGTYFKTGVYMPLKKPKEISPSKPDIIESMTTDASKKTQMGYLVQRLYNLSEGEYFFNVQFIDNYFPDFRSISPNFRDIRTIIVKSESNGYTSIYEIIQDLRQIILDAKKYLAMRKNDLLKAKTIAFKDELTIILSHEMFSSLDFNQVA